MRVGATERRETRLGQWPSSIGRFIASGSAFRDPSFYRIFLPLYLASFAWVFLIPAEFWDDLNIKNNPDIVATYTNGGFPLGGWLLREILLLPGADFIGQAIGLLSCLVSVIFLRRFLGLLEVLEERERNAIALLSAVLPLYQSRFMLALALHSLPAMFFCVGIYLLAKAFRIDGSARWGAYVCLVLSFMLEPFLVLYGAALSLIFFSAFFVKIKTSVPFGLAIYDVAKRFLTRMPEALLLPFLYYAGKLLLFPNKDVFVNYNVVNLQTMWQGIFQLPKTTIKAILAIPGPLPPWSFLCASIVFMTLLLACSFFPRQHRRNAGLIQDGMAESGAGGRLLSFVLAGICVMFAVYPYAVVGRIPTPYDFSDRFQLTMVLTVGAFIYFTVKLFVRPEMKWGFIIAIIAVSLAYNARAYVDVIIDGHTQNAVVRELSRSAAVKSGAAFVVDVSNWPSLSRQRRLGTGQMNCLLKDALGDEERFAGTPFTPSFDWRAELKILNRYRHTGTCFRDFRGGVPEILKIRAGPRVLFGREAIKMSFLRLFAGERYERHLEGLIAVSVTPIPDGLSKQPGNSFGAVR